MQITYFFEIIGQMLIVCVKNESAKKDRQRIVANARPYR